MLTNPSSQPPPHSDLLADLGFRTDPCRPAAVAADTQSAPDPPPPQGEAPSAPARRPFGVFRLAIFRRSAWKAFVLFFPAWWYVGVLVLVGAVVADLLALGLSAVVPGVPWPYGDTTSMWLSLACQLGRGFPC